MREDKACLLTKVMECKSRKGSKDKKLAPGWKDPPVIILGESNQVELGNLLEAARLPLPSCFLSGH